MNTFKRKALFAAVVAGLGVAGCSLTPEQFEAIGKSRSGTTACFHADAAGFKSTTVVTVGSADSKRAGMQVVMGEDCSTRTAQGAAAAGEAGAQQ